MSTSADLPWYHSTTIYQVYPRSFYDTNADGIGDIQGIIAKLDYIKSIGYETLWCSPFFKSANVDFGYDITGYTEIDPLAGDMSDALQLIDEVHKRGMKIVLDMVMNHTSMEHPWFKGSSSSRDNPKADWYIWRDKPTNWYSMTGGTGWHYSAGRDQYFWASFLPFQPDLNYRNPEVKKTMLENVKFWLDKNIDGFRLDIFNVIYKDAEYRDNPFKFKILPSESDPSSFFQQAKYSINQPETAGFARELRAVCDEYGSRMLLGEVFGDRQTIRRFAGAEKNDGLGLVFDFEMLPFKFNAAYFHTLIANLEKDFPYPFMPVYVFSNHDRRRSIRRIGNDLRKAKVLHLMQLTVRGVPCMYMGEEIGMTDARYPYSTSLDPIGQKYKAVPRIVFDIAGETMNRDEVRTPMQWDASKNAGFSNAERTWLPLHENYKEVNVASAMKDENSLLEMVRQVLSLRNEIAALHSGSLELISDLPKGVLAYKRIQNGEELLIAVNFTESKKEFPLPGHWSKLFSLVKEDGIENGSVGLSAFGGMVLKK
jgi:glycosidase